jgi:hypothetical protein
MEERRVTIPVRQQLVDSLASTKNSISKNHFGK